MSVLSGTRKRDRDALPTCSFKTQRVVLNKRIGENIKRVRLLRGMTQGALGLILQARPQEISLYERGERRIPADTLVQIGFILEADLVFLTQPYFKTSLKAIKAREAVSSGPVQSC